MITHGIAVDPGLRGCGIAVFNLDTKKLVHAEYIKNPTTQGNDFESAASMATAVRAAVVWPIDLFWGECPKVYPAGNQKGDQNDLIHLAGHIYMIAGYLDAADLVRFYPREWKGTIDADDMIDRIIGRLNSEENARVRRAGALTHNVWDAVGIGLHALGRLEPKRVFGGING